MPKAKKKTEAVQIQGLDLKVLELKIVGKAPLIMHKWSEKAKKQIRDKQQKKAAATAKKEARNPQAEFEAAIYRVKDFITGDNKDTRYAFPAIAFKKAAVEACRQLEGLSMVMAKTLFHVEGEYVVIDANDPEMREDTVVIGQGTTDLRYRPQFWPWSANIQVKYNAAAVSEEQLINIFQVAGFASGIGENRPNKTGDIFGMFEIEVI